MANTSANANTDSIIVNFEEFNNALSVFDSENSVIEGLIGEFRSLIEAVGEGWEGTPAEPYIQNLRSKIDDCQKSQTYLQKFRTTIEEVRSQYETNETNITSKLESELTVSGVFTDEA